MRVSIYPTTDISISAQLKLVESSGRGGSGRVRCRIGGIRTQIESGSAGGKSVEWPRCGTQRNLELVVVAARG